MTSAILTELIAFMISWPQEFGTFCNKSTAISRKVIFTPMIKSKKNTQQTNYFVIRLQKTTKKCVANNDDNLDIFLMT